MPSFRPKWLPVVLICMLFGCQQFSHYQQLSTIQIVTLPNLTAALSGEPYLMTNNTGKVWLSWIEKSDSNHILKYTNWLDTGWSVPFTITTGSNWFVNWADYPHLGQFPDGNLIAGFLQKSALGKYAYDVMITSQNNQNDWSTPKVLHDDKTSTEHGFIALQPWKEEMLAVWLDGRNTLEQSSTEHNHALHNSHGAMSLRATLIANGNNIRPSWELDNKVCDCCQTTLGITKNGPIVFYRNRSNKEIRNIAMVRWVNGKWTNPMDVFNDNWKIDGCPVNGPVCDVKNNTVAVAWYTAPNDSTQVKISFSTNSGATFSKPRLVNDSSTIGRLDMILMNENTAVVSYIQNGALMIRSISKNGQRGPAIKLTNLSEKRASGFPQLTPYHSNKILAAWTHVKDSVSCIKTALVTLNWQ